MSVLHFIDAHIHPYDLVGKAQRAFDPGLTAFLCASSHTMEELVFHRRLSGTLAPATMLCSFGIHPQEPDDTALEVLDRAIELGMVDAIGECGFDLYNPAFRASLDAQILVWNAQVERSLRHGLPLVIHSRKALPLIFESTARLSRLPSVIFHGWPGSPEEGIALLKRGVNAYFSLGKGVLRGQKTVLHSALTLPGDRILTETDAPWMAGRGEAYSQENDIQRVSQCIADLRSVSLDTLCSRIEDNFREAFLLTRPSREPL